MNRQNKQTANSALVVVSTRLPPALIDRIDWLARNDDETHDRSEGIRKAIEEYCETREIACKEQGLTPPAQG